MVEDTLPNDVTISGSVYAPSPWTCSITGNGNRSFRCTTTSTLSVGQSFADIRVNAVASTAIPAGVYTNIVTLSNSGDVNPINNTDPANIRVEIGPRCDSLSATVRNGGSPLTTTLTCSGRNLTGSLTYQYKIRCYEGDTAAIYGT